MVVVVGLLLGLGGILVLFICFGGGSAFTFSSNVGEASMMDIRLSKEEPSTVVLEAASAEPEVNQKPVLKPAARVEVDAAE